MCKWRNLNQWMFDLDTFNHLYMWILLNSVYEGGVQLWCVVLGERKYIQSTGKIREDLFFKVRMRPSCKRLESVKYVYGGVYTFKPMNDIACGDYVYQMEMFVIKGCDNSGIDQLGNKADSDCLRAAKSM
ncbi:hypothetical protein NQ095_08020 [Rossellomorea sp. SC111]|uniref:hypothetical protein n=1 Tax=Rossellomorea sp. SC111 TaxID=2968985 RepID=UPI00215AE962|nr:hypothetical protein [Rossellomorea sp. SC111]MCR8848345.1 hypothetical protein [Rossellomorea sp. SC111]